MGKNITIAVLLLACIGLGFLAVNRGKQPRIAETPEPVEAPTPIAEDPETGLSIEELVPDALPSEPEPEPESTTASASDTGEDSEEMLKKAHDMIAMLVEEREESQEKLENNPFERMKKAMRDDPEMRKMMATQAEAQMVMQYKGFFDRTELAPETAAALRELLSKQHAESMKHGMAFMGSKEERKAATEAIKAATKAQEAEVAKLLGGEELAAFKKWEKQMPHRQMLKQVGMQMGAAEGFTTEQEDAMVELMARRNEELKGMKVPDMQAGDIPKPKDVELILERQAKLHELYAQDAKVILSEDQHQAYKQGLDRQIQMMRFGMKMGAQFMGGEDAE